MQGCFAESTLSGKRRSFAEFILSRQSEILRFAQNDSEGLRMTSEEPALPSTPLRDSERSRTVSEANGAQHDRIDFFSNLPKCPD